MHWGCVLQREVSDPLPGSGQGWCYHLSPGQPKLTVSEDPSWDLCGMLFLRTAVFRDGTVTGNYIIKVLVSPMGKSISDSVA